MNSAIQTAISALGYSENGVYHREMDCFETILDIIRYLRNDSTSMDARIECGRHNLIECDLIPLLKIEDLKIEDFDVGIRLLINLCQPAMASMRGKAPSDREEWKTYWDLEENLKRAKKAFTDPQFFRILKSKLENFFFETDLLDEKDRLLMERIILLLKYVFSINQDRTDKQRTDNNSTDNVILAFLDAGMDRTLTRIADMPKEREFHVAILDIFSLILKDHTPDDLAFSTEEEIDEKRKRETEEYFKKVNEEHLAKESAKRRSFSRFGGSYVIKGMSSNTAVRDQVVFKPIRNITAATFNDQRKVAKRVAKNRRALEITSGSGSHVSSAEVRQKLKSMVTNLTTSGFDRMMKSSKQIVFGQKQLLQRNSQINYFFLIKFVLRFVRLSNLPLAGVSQCTGVEAFHENNVQLSEYIENATTLKSLDAKSFGLKAHYALGAYNELLLLHQHAYEKGTETDRKMARNALEHVLKVEEYRDLTLTLLKKFNPAVLSKNFLRELIMVAHNYNKLLERFAKSGKLKHVSKKVKVKKAKKPRKLLIDEDNRAQYDKMSEQKVLEFWELASEKVEKVVRGQIAMIEDMNPLNLNVEVEDTLQQQFAMLSIQRSLRAKGFPAAVGLYRAARKIWMVEGIFGNDEMSPEEELDELKQICVADLKEVATKLKTAEEEAAKALNKAKGEDGEENELESDEDEEEEEEPCWKVEQIAFDLDVYFGRFAKIEVLRWYVYALEEFKKNSTELNKAIVKLMHRVAFDLKMIVRLFQISLFNIFELVDEHMSNVPHEKKKESPYFELHEFGHHVLKRFFKKYSDFGVDLAVETLFWKGGKEAYEIENGYGSYAKEKEADSRVWTEELELEVKNLYDEFMAMDEDDRNVHVIDFIESNMTRKRSKKQVYRKMCDLGLRVIGSIPIELDPKMNSLPADKIKKIYAEWEAMEEKEKTDVVDLIRERLADEHGDIPRRKIIKFMNYVSMNYERPKKERKEKSLPKWDEGLIRELEGLKEKYEDIDDAEKILGVDIVRYVMKRISEKKPVRQVERYLISMGAKVQERPKRQKGEKKEKSKKFNQDDFLNDGSEDEVDEKSGSEEEEEGEEPEEENKESAETMIKKKKKKIMIESDDEDIVESRNEENETTGTFDRPIENEKENDGGSSKEQPSKKISLLDRIRNRKRKFAQLSYSDEEDSDDDSDKEKKEKDQAMEDMLDERVAEVSLYKRRFFDDVSLIGTVAAGELRESSGSPEPDPFTRSIAYKKRIVMSDNEDED